MYVVLRLFISSVIYFLRSYLSYLVRPLFISLVMYYVM